MEPYDMIMLAVLLAAVVFGAWKGLAWQVASLAAIFASCFVAYQFRDTFAKWIPVPAPWRVWLAMLFLFMLTSAGIWVIFQWVARFIDRLKLKEFDRQIGALLGLAKGIVLCVIITLFAVGLLGDSQRQRIVNSRSGFFVGQLLGYLKGVLPEAMEDVLEPFHRAWEERDEGSQEASSEQGGELPYQAPPLPANWRD